MAVDSLSIGSPTVEPELVVPSNVSDGDPSRPGSVNARIPDPSADPPTKEAPADSGERPEWLPEGFKTPEDLAKSYQELRKKLSEKAPAGKKADLSGEAVDFDAVATEFVTNGELSEDTFASLEAKGITRSTVEKFIAGQQALASQLTSEFHSIIGGQEQYTEFLGWAKESLSEGEIAAYDRALQSDPEAAKVMLKGFAATMKAAAGGKLLSGKPAPSGEGYASTAEMVADMKSPKYQTDPAFRQRVAAKLSGGFTMKEIG